MLAERPKGNLANRRIVNMASYKGLGGGGTYAAGKHDVEQNAEGPKVDSIRVRKSESHFWCGVSQSAHLLVRRFVV